MGGFGSRGQGGWVGTCPEVGRTRTLAAAAGSQEQGDGIRTSSSLRTVWESRDRLLRNQEPGVSESQTRIESPARLGHESPRLTNLVQIRDKHGFLGKTEGDFPQTQEPAFAGSSKWCPEVAISTPAATYNLERGSPSEGFDMARVTPCSTPRFRYRSSLSTVVRERTVWRNHASAAPAACST